MRRTRVFCFMYKFLENGTKMRNKMSLLTVVILFDIVCVKSIKPPLDSKADSRNKKGHGVDSSYPKKLPNPTYIPIKNPELGWTLRFYAVFMQRSHLLQIKTLCNGIEDITVVMFNDAFFLDYHLKTIKFLVRYGGMSLDSRRRTFTNKIRDRSVYVMNILWFNFDVFGAVAWFIHGLANGKNIVLLSRIAPCVVFSFVANVKGYFYVRREDDINELIDSLRQLEGKVRTRQIDDEEEIVLKEETNFLAIVIKTLNVINVILLMTFALSPFILIAYKYFNTGELDLILPFLVLYPFDSKDIRIWPFVYLHQIWSECVGVLNVCVSDYFFYICCTFIKIQFRLLHLSLENYLSENNEPRTLTELHSDLFKMIKWHQELIRLANVLEVVYTDATICNFLCSSLMICLTGFSVMATEDLAFGITFLVFLSSNLMQIFLLCLFGDMIMRSSTEVGDAIYRTTWFEADLKIRKKLLFIQTRALKPCKLTASGFTDVNLLAFTKILSSAWSYFALLKTMYSLDRN